jgi:hypothetical protein
LPAGTPLRSSTLAGHLFQPWIIGLSLLPFLRWGSAGVLLLRLAVLVVLLSSVMAADVPLILLGAIEDTLLHYLDRAGTTNSPLVLWMNFMNGGGRLVLPLLAFGLTALPGASAPGSVRAAAERSQI